MQECRISRRAALWATIGIAITRFTSIVRTADASGAPPARRIDFEGKVVFVFDDRGRVIQEVRTIRSRAVSYSYEGHSC